MTHAEAVRHIQKILPADGAGWVMVGGRTPCLFCRGPATRDEVSGPGVLVVHRFARVGPCVIVGLRLNPSGIAWEGFLDPRGTRDQEVFEAVLRAGAFEAWFFDAAGRPIGGKRLSKLAPEVELRAIWEGARQDPDDFEAARAAWEREHVPAEFLAGTE